MAAAAGLAVFGRIILQVWTHGEVAMDSSLFGWLLSSAIASMLWSNARIVLQASNRHIRMAFLYVLVCAAGVGVAALLLTWTGDLTAVGLAILGIDLFMTAYTLRAVGYLLEERSTVSLVRAANPVPLLRLAGHCVSQFRQHVFVSLRRTL